MKNESDMKRRAFQREQRALERIERARALRTEGLLAGLLHVGVADGPLNTVEIEGLIEMLVSEEPECRVDLEVPSWNSGQRLSRIGDWWHGGTLRSAKRRRVMELLFDFADCDAADHVAVNDAEIEALREISDCIELSEEQFLRYQQMQQLRRKVRERANARPGTERPSARVEKAAPLWCYEILGCAVTDTEATIKRSYRRLAAVLHPDKHAAKDAESVQTARRVEEFQKLQAAYEAIRKCWDS